MVPSPTIWCGIPVYNNAATIVDIARRCREQIEHVLVIDDGSTDANLTVLLGPLDVTVVRHPINRGKGEALLTAFRYAADHGAGYLITLDGDGQHFPEDLPRFFPHLAAQSLVIGYREEVSGTMPQVSQFGRDFSDFWIRLEAGGYPRDTQSGFRAYPLAAVSQLRLRSRFYNFEMEIVTKAMWAGLRVHSVPIRVYYPPASQRISSFDPYRDNLRISMLHLSLVVRQMLPIPHRRIDAASYPLPTIAIDIWHENSSPAGLATSAGLSVLMGIVLWPLGLLAVIYVAIRLHLNKIIALPFSVACLLPVIPKVCHRTGQALVSQREHPFMCWLTGAHVVAVPLSIAVGCGVYFSARYLQKNKQP